MMPLVFPYRERSHPVFGTILRPVLRLGLYSTRFMEWVALDDVLADTGADLSVVPLPLGRLLVPEIESGQPIQLGGVVSSTSQFNAYIHQVQAQLGDQRFEMPLAIVTSRAVPPILGRRQALDRFVVRFVSGQELIFEL